MARTSLRVLLGGSLLLATVVLVPARVLAVTIVPQDGSLFADHSALTVGDIVTILIVESSSASKATLTKTNVSAEHGGSSSDQLDVFGLWGLDASNSSLGEGSTARRGDLQARVSVQITEIQDGGLLRVEGTRSVLVNGEEEKIALRGSLRPQDIQPDNTVLSTYLANASIEYTGEGVLASAERPGFVTRIFNWLF